MLQLDIFGVISLFSHLSIFFFLSLFALARTFFFTTLLYSSSSLLFSFLPLSPLLPFHAEMGGYDRHPTLFRKVGVQIGMNSSPAQLQLQSHSTSTLTLTSRPAKSGR
uniref:Uncharacterized protein n=1 Tax=Palpitomonas bilix TaxID=652834 RepID=A0A7S3DHH3_9EUKA|mmetsp:Transcript_35799/g.93316  ORF Transcript_35799/g.93316 Transcript_35799/m.93316 type:complete len:108 (+) Transcript_35799:100-423(+)